MSWDKHRLSYLDLCYLLLLRLLRLRLLQACLHLTIAFFKCWQQVFIDLIFPLDEKHRMQFFISPVKVHMQQKELLHGHFCKHGSLLFVSQIGLQSISEHFAHSWLNSKISCEVKLHKLVSVQSIDTHIHLVQLGFGRFEGFFELACFELCEDVLMQELEHVWQLLLVCFFFALFLIFFLPASTATASASASSTPVNMLVLLLMHHLVLIGEVVFKVDAFLILQLNFFLFNFSIDLNIIVVCSESKQGCCVDSIDWLGSVVHDVEMGLLLVFSLKGDVAFWLALVVGTDEMRLCEMPFERGVIAVVHVFVEVVAQMTR